MKKHKKYHYKMSLQLYNLIKRFLSYVSTMASLMILVASFCLSGEYGAAIKVECTRSRSYDMWFL